MATFQDDNKREWKLSITVGSERQIRKQTGIHVRSAEAYEQVFTNPDAAIEIVLILTAHQRQTQNVSDHDFINAMGGDAIDAMVNAIMEAITEFLPFNLQKAGRRMLDQLRAVEQAAADRAYKLIDNFQLSDVETPAAPEA